MSDGTTSLRGLGIGIVNVLGIAVPGCILVSLTVAGVLPIISIVLNVRGLWLPMPQQWGLAAIWLTAVFLTVSYLIGYILRLASPDELDRLSAVRRGGPGQSKVHFPTDTPSKDSAADKPAVFGVLRRILDLFHLSEESRQKLRSAFDGTTKSLLIRCVWRSHWWWVRCSDDRDKYPYRGLSSYVLRTNEDELISWTNADKPQNALINWWKCDIQLLCPELALRVDSEEAHIRLLSGTWHALRAARLPVLAGLLATGNAGFGPFAFKTAIEAMRTRAVWYQTGFVLTLTLAVSMVWASSKIERLFHPRRVGELLYILRARELAKAVGKKNGLELPPLRRFHPHNNANEAQ